MDTLRNDGGTGNLWLTVAKFVLSVVGIAALMLIMCGVQGCGADETAPPKIVYVGNEPTDDGNNNLGNVSGGYGQPGNNNAACPDEVEATLWVNSLYGGQVLCGGVETPFEEGVVVSGICMSNKGFTFVVYTEAGPASFSSVYDESGKPATLEFRVGTAPPQLQSEFTLDWGTVVIVTVP